jgi:hypothetical protein
VIHGKLLARLARTSVGDWLGLYGVSCADIEKEKSFRPRALSFNRPCGRWTVDGDRNERSHDLGENSVQKLRISKPQFLNLIR